MEGFGGGFESFIFTGEPVHVVDVAGEYLVVKRDAERVDRKKAGCMQR